MFYGDKNNWWACYAFWVFQLFGHTNARVMDGGRVKWEKEGRPLTATCRPTRAPSTRRRSATTADRAFREEVLAHMEARRQLVDVRSPEEYAGTRMHMPDYPNEGALRGGHIPGAKSIPWARAINPEDGTFKTAAELRSIYARTNSSRRQADDRLLPHRRAQQPHLVRAEVPARLQEREELRRLAGPSGAIWSVCRSRSETYPGYGFSVQGFVRFRFSRSRSAR